MGFNLTYWTPMGGCYFFMGYNLENFGKFWKNGRFSGRIWPDWGNAAWADMAGLGSIGLINRMSISAQLTQVIYVRFNLKLF